VTTIRLTLYRQRCIRYENVFTPCGRGAQGIPRSLCPRCATESKSQGRHSVHISRYGLSSCRPRHEGTGPGFTSPGERFLYVFMETYSVLVLIIVRDIPGPWFTLGEPPTFYRNRLHNLPSYLVIGASLQNSKLSKVNTESNSQLACHLMRLLWSLYGLICVSSS
jgi:hypothetical protein